MGGYLSNLDLLLHFIPSFLPISIKKVMKTWMRVERIQVDIWPWFFTNADPWWNRQWKLGCLGLLYSGEIHIMASRITWIRAVNELYHLSVKEPIGNRFSNCLIVYFWRMRWMPCLPHPSLTMDKAGTNKHSNILSLLELAQSLQQRTTETVEYSNHVSIAILNV